MNIEHEVVAYLGDENQKIFCTAVLITNDRGICIFECFQGKNVWLENYYAYVVLELGQEIRSAMKIQPYLYNTNGFELFKVSTSTGNQWNQLNLNPY